MPALRVILAAIALVAAGSPAAAAEVPFEREVMAVLSRAGCNAGACHGNLNGKGGFKLSLRGEDAAADFATLTRDMLGPPHRPPPARSEPYLVESDGAGSARGRRPLLEIQP